jgi:hypothetical protein
MTYIITNESITVVANGQSYTLSATHGNFNAVLDAIRAGAPEAEVIELINPRIALTKYLGGAFEVSENSVKYNGEEVHGVLVQRILECHRNGLPLDPLLRFFENLERNDSRRARLELYSFLAHGNMPITPDGCFLAYKSLRGDYTDHHTGKFSNRVGSTLRMERRKVCDDAGIGCSYGFHAGSLEYAQSFGSGDKRIVIVKINPEDVVSVPNDCEFQKLRTAKYEVVADYTGPLPKTYAESYDSTEDDIYNEEDVETDETDSDDSLVTAIRTAARQLLDAVSNR